MTCDAYQIAFDQLAAGASASMPAAEVDAHVATCAACTAYAELSRKMNVSMMNAISVPPLPLDLDAMRARVTHFRRQASRGLAIWPFVFGVALFANRFVVHWPGTWTQAVVSAVIGSGLAYAILAYRTRRYVSALTALEARSGDNLVAGVRAELDRRIRTERQGWWVLPIVLAAFHARFVGWALPSGPLLVFELCYLALFPLGVIRYRRAQRERALLA